MVEVIDQADPLYFSVLFVSPSSPLYPPNTIADDVVPQAPN